MQDGLGGQSRMQSETVHCALRSRLCSKFKTDNNSLLKSNAGFTNNNNNNNQQVNEPIKQQSVDRNHASSSNNKGSMRTNRTKLRIKTTRRTAKPRYGGKIGKP